MTSVQRQGTRAQIALDAVIEAAGALYYAETGTFSEGGLSLHTKKTFAVGTPLHIVLGKPPVLPKLNLEGTVRWLREGDIGVQFVSLKDEDKATISTYLNFLQQESKPEN